MRVGVVPSLSPADGGLYQYNLTILQALGTLAERRHGDEYLLFVPPGGLPLQLAHNGAHLLRVSLQPPSIRRQVLALLRAWAGEGRPRQAWRRWRRRGARANPAALPDPDQVYPRPEFGRWFKHHRVGWVLYPAPNSLAFEAGVPYVIHVPDLQHRLQPEFPEVSANGEWERREYIFRNGTRYATLILVDSEVGREDVLGCYGSYGVTADRVRVLPYLPACYLAMEIPESERLRVRSHYKLPERYLFYPAQFWPHKNHARIIEALGLLKADRREEISVVFCGSHTGEVRERAFQEVMTLAHTLGVAAQVHYLGYVPDEAMSGLYAEAVGLVMPTFFGPTNIPILEAWAFGCPVITSDIRGVREQVGDAGLVADPRSVEAIAGAIHRLWEDQNLRQELARRGRQRLASYTPEEFRRRLADVIQEANDRVREESSSGQY